MVGLGAHQTNENEGVFSTSRVRRTRKRVPKERPIIVSKSERDTVHILINKATPPPRIP